MSNDKQSSSIDWLINEHFGGMENCTPDFRYKIEQAKAMHKEEMFEYIKQKYCIGHKSLEFHRLEFEQYYAETFGDD